MCVCARPERCSAFTFCRVQDSCHCLDAKYIKNNYQSTTSTSQLSETFEKQDCGQAFWQIVTTSDLSSEAELTVSRCLYQLHKEPEPMLSHFTIFQTTCRLANCVDATSANSESMKTNSTMLTLVTSWKKRMMAVDVLLRNIQPK